MSDSWPGANTEVGADDYPGSDRLPEPARRALVSLLMSRYVSRSRNRAAWEGVLTFESDIRARLDEMFLDLVVDHEAGVAFKRQQDGDDVPRVLRKEKALTQDASFVLIFLRREYEFTAPDDWPLIISREQIGEFLRAYREDGDADGARFARRVDAAINGLMNPWKILEPDPDADYLFTVSPVIVPLVGVDEMHRFETAFREAAERTSDSGGDES